jgi:hypothetical protein
MVNYYISNNPQLGTVYSVKGDPLNKTLDKKWLEVLDVLESEMPSRHKNLFFSTNESEYMDRIHSLRENLDQLEILEIQVHLAKIVASIGDAHTSIDFPVNVLCPLEFYWFSDGIYPVNTAKADQVLRFKKITHIDGMAMEMVIEKMSEMISHENQSYLKSLLPKYLPAIEFLYGLRITDSIKGYTLTYLDESGDAQDWFVSACPYPQYQAQLQGNRVYTPQDELPLFRRKSDFNYWMEYLEPSKTLYFKYNICKQMVDEPVESFVEKWLRFIEESKPEKLVIDMRNNTGGNSTLLDPFIEALSKVTHLKRSGKLYVIIGRDTFSSALLNVFSLKNTTSAILIGEPTGGKPNCYGEVLRIKMEHSGIVINYSTKYYHLIEDDQMPSLYPDVQIEYTVKNYINRTDPCMDYLQHLRSF